MLFDFHNILHRVDVMFYWPVNALYNINFLTEQVFLDRIFRTIKSSPDKSFLQESSFHKILKKTVGEKSAFLKKYYFLDYKSNNTEHRRTTGTLIQYCFVLQILKAQGRLYTVQKKT